MDRKDNKLKGMVKRHEKANLIDQKSTKQYDILYRSEIGVRSCLITRLFRVRLSNEIRTLTVCKNTRMGSCSRTRSP